MKSPKSKSPARAKSASAADTDSTDLEAAQRVELRALATRLADVRFSRLRALFARLYPAPPQVLLLEGGSVGERLGAALYFAAGLNCDRAPEQVSQQSGERPELPPGGVLDAGPAVGPEFGLGVDLGVAQGVIGRAASTAGPRPCLECGTCRLVSGGGHRDLFILDGRAESIKIDTVRALRPVLGEAPHSARKRVVILAEAHFLVEAAANSLLKSLEEPRPGTVFILCTPQRRRLLQTLVSRSWVLTLPWPSPHYDIVGLPSPFARAGNSDSRGQGQDLGQDPGGHSPEEQRLKTWEQALIKFLHPETALAHAPAWMSLSAQKGGLDKHLALNFITHCRRALCAAVAFGRALPQAEAQGKPLESLGVKLRKLPALAKVFAGFTPSAQWEMSGLLDEADEALLYAINPALVLDRMAVRLFLLSL